MSSFGGPAPRLLCRIRAARRELNQTRRGEPQPPPHVQVRSRRHDERRQQEREQLGPGEPEDGLRRLREDPRQEGQEEDAEEREGALAAGRGGGRRGLGGVHCGEDGIAAASAEARAQDRSVMMRA